MIVVSNTSPLTNLAAIGQFTLLRDLYSQLHIANGVWAELNAYGQVWPGTIEVGNADWITRAPVENAPLTATLRRDLDRGEAESIALALTLNAELLLLDEKDGRHAAQRLGLRVLGTLGILLEAKQKGLLPAIHPLLDALRQKAGFYVSNRVYHHLLELADE